METWDRCGHSDQRAAGVTASWSETPPATEPMKPVTETRGTRPALEQFNAH